MRVWTGSRLIIGISMIILMLSAVACSGQAAPTAQPSQASMDQEEVQALMEAAVEAAVSKSTSRSEEVFREELREMLAEAVAGSPPGNVQVDVAELVSKSVADAMAAVPPPITKAELQQAEAALLAALREFPENIYLNRKLLDLRSMQLGFMKQLATLDQFSRRKI